MVYLRLVGDRSIPEEQFGNILKNRESEINYCAGELKEKQERI
jgi:hypothetical protein